MKSPLLRVVKIGGSLLDLPELGARVQDWLDSQPAAVNVLLAGGGKAVDQIRLETAQQGLQEVEAHWRCVDVMTTTANLLHQLMPDAKTQTFIPFFATSRPVIFSCATWLKNIEPLTFGTRLPESWDVTSDSIAARLAICTGADELVLLKSADPPSSDVGQLVALGYVDKFFAKLDGELPPWRMVNLRRILSPDQSS